MTALCVIPARAGSKRVKAKNVMPFLGKPMIAYSLAAARDAGIFDEIHVSTEDPGIRRIVEELGHAVPFLRPAELADDRTPLVPVLRWVIRAFDQRGGDFDSVCLLMSCAPLVRGDDLRAAHALFRDHGGEHPVLSVARFPAPAEWAYRLDGDGFIDPREPDLLLKRSQDIEDTYYDTGAFAIFPADRLRDETYGGGGRMLAAVLPAWRTVDIDTEDDLVLAEVLMRGLAGRDAARETSP